MKLQSDTPNVLQQMGSQRFNTVRRVALPLFLATLLSACDGAVFEAPVANAGTPGAVISDDPVVAVVDPVVSQNAVTVSPVASALLSDAATVGPVKIMATGDSITHGIVGVSSYRREFTSLMQAANCSFEMVGSQTTSMVSGRDPGCVDTGVIGDGWGWDGTQSCLVGSVADTVAYAGAHEGYSAHRADHFLTGHTSSAGSNAGIGASIASYNPDVVMLHVGSVDLYNQQDVTSTLVDIKNVVKVIFETKPQTLVLIANIIPWFSENPYAEIGRDITALGNGVERFVANADNPLLRLVDVRTGFTPEMMVADLIHPNAAGEAHIANAFMGAYQSVASCAVE